MAGVARGVKAGDWVRYQAPLGGALSHVGQVVRVTQDSVSTSIWARFHHRREPVRFNPSELVPAIPTEEELYEWALKELQS